MEKTTFLGHYHVCAGEDGSPTELNRVGAAITYKAVDLRSGDPVTVQLVPLQDMDETKRTQLEERARTAEQLDHINIAKVYAVGVDDDRLVVVSEYLTGDTLDAWVVQHGPMAPDVALRIGIQVVRALGAAAFCGLTHRAIQPSNLLIVPGVAPDMGWPLIKVLNFGLAGLELHSDSTEARELAPALAPQFASPEQLQGKEIEFRSEIYSLGATICFLLTGAVPLAPTGSDGEAGTRQLPEIRRAPKALRNLLGWLLRENPEERPLDPVALEAEFQNCLHKVERRQALGRKLGIPLATVVPRKARPVATPMAQVWRGVIAFAALLLAAAVIGAYFFPEKLSFSHASAASKDVGVPVGVPNAEADRVSNASVPPAGSPIANGQAIPAAEVAANQPPASPAPAGANINSSSPSNQAAPAPATVAQAQTVSSPPNPPNGDGSDTLASNQTVAPAAPAEGPSESETEKVEAKQAEGPREADEGTKSEASRNSYSHVERKRFASKSSHRSVGRQKLPNDDDAGGLRVAPRLYHSSWMRARFVGTAPDGRLMLRLPSGKVVFVRPRGGHEDTDAMPVYHRRVPRPDVSAPAPYAPGYSPYD